MTQKQAFDKLRKIFPEAIFSAQKALWHYGRHEEEQVYYIYVSMVDGMGQGFLGKSFEECFEKLKIFIEGCCHDKLLDKIRF